VAFEHTRCRFGRVRGLIDRINSFGEDLKTPVVPAPPAEIATARDRLG
jgi:hypothetical protein